MAKTQVIYFLTFAFYAVSFQKTIAYGITVTTFPSILK